MYTYIVHRAHIMANILRTFGVYFHLENILNPQVSNNATKFFAEPFPIWFQLNTHCDRLTLEPSVACCSYYDCHRLPKNKMLE